MTRCAAWTMALCGGLWVSGAAAEPSGSSERVRPIERAIVPLINFTTDRGLGYGGYGALFFMDPEGTEKAPYRLQVGAQWYKTTGGYQDHKLVVDVPALAGGKVRTDVHIGWERWDQAYYFGQGNDLPRLKPEDTPANLYAFGLNSVRSVSKVRVQLVSDWHAFAGHLARTADIDVYADSRLAEDNPVGTEGGLLSQAFAGIMVDSRNHEAVPSRGTWSEVSARVAAPAIGSTWAMWGINFTDRRYWSATPRLVLATRAALDIQRGETPFFHQIVMGGSQWVDVGGPLAMRGLPIGRYRGEVTVYGDAEIRWATTEFQVGRAHYRLFTVPFVNAARFVHPGEKDPNLHPHGGGGVGLRLLYNEVFQARFDVGVGREEYIAGGGGDARTERAWVPAVYLAFNTPY